MAIDECKGYIFINGNYGKIIDIYRLIIYVYIYIYSHGVCIYVWLIIWTNYSELTVLPHWNDG